MTPDNVPRVGRPQATGTCANRAELESHVKWFYDNTPLRAVDLASKYGVSLQTINIIIEGHKKERWKHYIKPTTRERQAEVLRMREEEGMTLQEVANELGVSRQRVHQIEEKANRLRDSVEAL
jgi:DNA-directed RNA polymerase specialized sigma subunit